MINTSNIPISTESGVVWIFEVPVATGECTEHVSELQSLCENIFTSFEGFLIPFQVSHSLRIYEEGNCPLQTPQLDDPIHRETQEIQNADGVTLETFLQSIDTDRPGEPWIPRVSFDHIKTQAGTNEGDRLIDRHDCTQYRNAERLDIESTWDPLEMSLSIVRQPSGDTNDTFRYELSVGVSSSIWIEDSNRGKRSRTHLRAFFDRLDATIEPERVRQDIRYAADFWRDLDITPDEAVFDMDLDVD